MMSGRRLVALRLAAVLVTVALSLAGTEALLRFAGRRPWVPMTSHHAVLHRPDPVLGWRPIAGPHVLPPYLAGAPAIRMTFEPDGARITAERPVAGAREIVFAGCSFTQGWATSDWQTWAWRVQRKSPATRVRNYGVGAFGTYQSLLLLEEVLAAPAPAGGRLVLFGLLDAHEIRNVATPGWLLMQAVHSPTGAVATPYCTLGDDGTLVRRPPARYPLWPLRESLATVAFLQQAYAEASARRRAGQGRAVTERLLVEMQRTSASHGARFIVVLLHFLAREAKGDYERFLRAQGIDTIDCAYPLTRAMMAPGEVHPSSAMHARWARCVLRGLRARGITG